ncbi:mitochondrial carnitine/acylcarnitine carrier protein [Planococcus citri]|uniref:mitochondrial carnitine/acylcarnitine carrier protein n=1 Tax=Planococcus citri TaxID=170843 RepID=UPI0031F8CF9D
MSENQSPVKYFLAGGLGGVCTVLVGHPLDTIKVRLQTMPLVKAGESPLYRGTWDCAVKTVQKEGFKGLYKGMSAPLTGVAPIFAISFLGYGLGKKIFAGNSEAELTKLQILYAGAFSGIFTTSIMAPGERIKCLLQVQDSAKKVQYNGPVDVIKKLYSEGGIRSIYKGTCATLLRDIPASGMYFMTYEVIKEALTPAEKQDTLGQKLLIAIPAGGMAGILNWVVAMPADVLKSRLQTAPEGTYPNGLRDVFRKLMAEEGVPALFKGITPVMVRAFPANAACFIGLEFGFMILNWIAPNL